MLRLGPRSLAFAVTLAATSLASTAFAGEVATPCGDAPLTCAEAPAQFSKEVALPVQGGFDTGWVPQGSALQVHLFAQLFASTSVDLAGRLVTSWPDPLTLEAPGDPGGGAMNMHYGFDIGAEASVSVTVLGQTFNWTGPIPYLPQFDFQVQAGEAFDPWAFDGVTVDGSSMEATLAQVSATDFIGVNIPGLDGGFELNVKADLAGTYRTLEVRVEEDGAIAASITGAVSAPVADFAGGGSVDYRVHPIGEIQYDGTLHLIPAFYIDTIGPSWSIPIADIPIPFSFVQKDWEFDPVDIHVKLPDVALPTDPEGPAPVTEPVVFDLGSIEVGALGTQALSLGNTGEAELASVLSSDDPAVTVPPTLDLTPGATASFDALVKPTEPGQFESTIVVASNDPDEPEREIVLRYEATPAPSDDGDGDGDDGTYLDDVTPSGGGCACATSPGAGGVGGGAGALGLGFAAIAVLRRRARRQARAAR
ncbi:MAG TPA: hypothetical protein VL400_00140 [Polyangiaceae bacterium]|nr:hypothetical protein [Polyangiaceae bacterium]